MVLQRDQPDPVWGRDTPGVTVTVTMAGQSKSAKADGAGKWRVTLDPMPASKQPLSMTVKGSNTVEFKNVLVGEVWLCSGQSNMVLPLNNVWNAEVEAATMKHPGLRLLAVPWVGTQEPQDDFAGSWKVCTPENALPFSAVALFYGRYLHLALDVPVGLVHNAVGGSPVEAWIDRKALEKDPQFSDVIADTIKTEWRATNSKWLAKYENDVVAFDKDMEAWQAEIQKNPDADLPRPRHPKDPRDFMAGNQRPGNLFNGALHPLIGYGIRGVIWYQGEANVRDAVIYRKLFPKLITGWRELWQQGDFPFYWVQLPCFGEVPPEPDDSAWAELREAQSMTLSLPHTGQCVTIDIGEAADLHPRNKLDVAARLARWALVNDYKLSMPFRSPELKEMKINENKIVLSFNFTGDGLLPDDLKGFAICGEDRKWVNASARVVPTDLVEVSSPEVPHPIAVRYGWADNPGVNFYTKDALPVTPFRTDDFPFPSHRPNAGAANAPAPAAH
ncbi:MAG TPA: sialate O-acetylesterase, partial [Verrucomicrobiaceae bacterium]